MKCLEGAFPLHRVVFPRGSKCGPSASEWKSQFVSWNVLNNYNGPLCASLKWNFGGAIIRQQLLWIIFRQIIKVPNDQQLNLIFFILSLRAGWSVSNMQVVSNIFARKFAVALTFSVTSRDSPSLVEASWANSSRTKVKLLVSKFHYPATRGLFSSLTEAKKTKHPLLARQRCNFTCLYSEDSVKFHWDKATKRQII